MTKHNTKYTLNNLPGKKKYQCPSCGTQKSLTRYIDSETHDELADEVGICDRINNCNYHYTPKKYFTDNPGLKKDFKPSFLPRPIAKVKPTSYIEFEYLIKSLNKDHRRANNLFLYLASIFNEEIAHKLCDRYLVGTSKRWNGASIYWQMDIEMKIRTGCIMLHNAKTGKRIHTPEIDQEKDWVHSRLKSKGVFKEFNLQQCFFGEHLLSFEIDMPIAIVESERTAIICSLYEPNYIWLATGGIHSLNVTKCQVLKGRKVLLCPDLGKGFEIWNEKAKKIRQELHLNIKVSELLEKLVVDENEKLKGFDLEDYYLVKNAEGKAIKNGIEISELLTEWETIDVKFK